ncbi:MAG: mechanosensitive ion channel [Fuerstiella sp.]
MFSVNSALPRKTPVRSEVRGAVNVWRPRPVASAAHDAGVFIAGRQARVPAGRIFLKSVLPQMAILLACLSPVGLSDSRAAQPPPQITAQGQPQSQTQPQTQTTPQPAGVAQPPETSATAQATPEKTATEPDVVPPKQDAITSEALEQLRAQVEAATELDEDQKKRILDTLQQASAALGQAVKLETQTPLDRAAIDSIGTRFQDLQSELTAANGPNLTDIPKDASLADLTSALASRQPKLQDAKQKLAALEIEPNRRVERRTAIASKQATYTSRKAEIEKALAQPAPPDESAFATAARRALLMAQMREINAEAPALQAELSRYEAEKAVDMTALRIQLAKREVSRLQQEVDELNKRITVKRSEDALYIAEQLELFAKGEAVPTPYIVASPSLYSQSLEGERHKLMAAETASLARQNVELTTQITAATNDYLAAQKTLEALRALRSRMEDKISRVGLTGAIGLELRRHLRTLQDPGVVSRRCNLRQDLMRDLEFTRLDLEDQTVDVANEVEQLEADSEEAPATSVEMRLAQDRYVTLTTLGRNYGEYFNRLGELDVTEQEFIRELKSFSNFIRERALWIRSNRLPEPEDASEISAKLNWFLSGRHWQQVRDALWLDATSETPLYALVTLLICMLFLVQGRFRRTLATIGEQTSRSSCRSFYPTIRATVLTVILSLTWPALPAFFCWRLLADSSASAFPRAVGEGLLAVTVGFLTANLMRQICRNNGLALSHFEWAGNAVRLLRTRLYHMMVVLLPLLFVENTLHAYENPQGHDALERSLFFLSLLVLAYFEVKLLHPRTGVFRDYFAAQTEGWACRFRWFFYYFVVAVPLILAGLTFIGYYYTAYELSWRLHVTTWALIGLFVLRCFLVRWFVVRHRELRIEQARQRRQALAEDAASGTSSIPRPTVEETAVDLQEVSLQTQRLINSGLAIMGIVVTWFVWVDVLPALAILDRWEMWSATVDTTVEHVDADGQQTFRTVPRVESFTAADGLIALLLTLLTFTAARNIPGLLEMTILQQLPLEPAVRYAIRTVARYLIVVVGLVLASNAIGIGWSKVQWLAAALTVGLGFGLQEIFANFVSGLIILFERPVRIGDVVTIADVSGTVSQIHIRATTITDWDRKEYVVPNKEFVTGRLLNWTLTDKINRVVINVGVAYGSDTLLARSLLLQVAQDHPDVLEDPPPLATFEGFGDSTLNLVLRCFLPNLENRLPTITQIHEAIDREFKNANIEISFPQRDLHVRSLPEQLSARLAVSDSDSPENAADKGDQR